MLETLQQLLYVLGGGFCHQISGRSFEAGGLYFPVCARDTGIFLGLVVTLAVLLLMTTRWEERPAALPPVPVIVLCALLAVPLVLDGASSYLGLRETDNLTRYVTGYLCGSSLGVLTCSGMFALLPRANRRLSVAQRPVPLVLACIASAAVGVGFYLVFPLMGPVAPFGIVCCLWASVAFVNALVLCTTRRWQQSPSRRRAALALLCFLLALLEMLLLSLAVSTFELLFPWIEHP